MSINFSQSIDRDLKSVRRLQRIVSNLLGPCTRHVAGKDDTNGHFHRAAVGSGFAHPTIYALTGMIVAETVWPNVPDSTAIVVFARTWKSTYAVFYVMTDPEKYEGLEYSAIGIARLKQLPAALTRRSETVARASTASLPTPVGPTPDFSVYANAPEGWSDYANLPNGPGDRSLYGVAIVAP